MNDLKQFEVWFATGSQHLYGPETLKQVAEDSQKIVKGLNDSGQFACTIVFKPVLTTPDAIATLCSEANTAANCVGVIAWMHTFSPAKMWIRGLQILQNPCSLPCQFNRDIPWDTIDMDFMNLNQSAHGGRELDSSAPLRNIAKWSSVIGRTARPNSGWMCGCERLAWYDAQGMKVARFGDNMREVAVTEGDKVEAQKQFGYSVNGYGVGDLVAVVNAVTDAQIDALVKQYETQYNMKVKSEHLQNVREAARIEVGLRRFLEDGGFKAFTTTFEDLHGLAQLPGLAVQRLMADGYGFGAEGDWKTAALVRSMKVMATGLKGGTSFMEDYTYHMNPAGMKVLGAHMLEVCPSIADGKVSLETHPLGIGGKDDPARLVFNVAHGAGLNASLIDMGNRFRLLINTVDVVAPDKDMPKLPVARVVWVPKPNLKVAAAAWILAGGAHHTGFSMALTREHLEDFADIAGIEAVTIDETTDIRDFKKELRFNEVYYWMNKALM